MMNGNWEEPVGEIQHLSETLKNKLVSALVLALPRFDKDWIVSCDASDSAMVAVLEQVGDDGLIHPVYYYSRRF